MASKSTVTLYIWVPTLRFLMIYIGSEHTIRPALTDDSISLVATYSCIATYSTQLFRIGIVVSFWWKKPSFWFIHILIFIADYKLEISIFQWKVCYAS